MERISDLLDGLNSSLASIVRWTALAMVLIQFAIVIGRYAYGVNSIAAQESVLYLHATLFMLGAGYTLQMDKHVRVDIFYARVGWRARRRIDLFGHLCLLIPSMLALLYWTWPSVVNAWKILEGPISVGGLKAVFLLKSLIPAFAVLLILQSLSSVLRLLLQRERG